MKRVSRLIADSFSLSLSLCVTLLQMIRKSYIRGELNAQLHAREITFVH